MTSTCELFGRHPDFEEGHACGSMGLARFQEQKALESLPGFVPHWLVPEGKLPNSYSISVFNKGNYCSYLKLLSKGKKYCV